MVESSTVADPTDELGHKVKNFDSHLKTIEAKKVKQVEQKEKEEATLEDLRRRERNLASTQGGLVANRRVRHTPSSNHRLTVFLDLREERPGTGGGDPGSREVA